jgi:hypothetical protein
MALVHPSKPAVPRKGELHPGLALLAGFAFIFAMAWLVHLVFGVIL